MNSSFINGAKTLDLVFVACHFAPVNRSDNGVNLLASLCDKYHTSEDELKRMMEITNKLITDILKKKPCPASEFKTENLDHVNTGLKVLFILSLLLHLGL